MLWQNSFPSVNSGTRNKLYKTNDGIDRKITAIGRSHSKKGEMEGKRDSSVPSNFKICANPTRF